MTLLELAERCEVATGPDRELDHGIAEALGWRRITRLPPENGGDEVYDCGSEWAALPKFTASIDAAMTLVPEGWEFIRLEHQHSWPNDPRGDCIIFEAVVMELHGNGYVGASGLTKSLAICVAALRARAAR